MLIPALETLDNRIAPNVCNFKKSRKLHSKKVKGKINLCENWYFEIEKLANVNRVTITKSMNTFTKEKGVHWAP